MVKTTSTENDWRNATGRIDYNMTNDYTFRIILQKHNNVLKGLISSMMHIPPEDIDTVEVTNPIHPGDSINDKEYVLDVKVNLNDKSIINLEMQVVDEGNWANRSLVYLCRTFDNVQKGNDYNTVTAVTHICSKMVTIHSQYHVSQTDDRLWSGLAGHIVLAGISHFPYMTVTAASAAVESCA